MPETTPAMTIIEDPHGNLDMDIIAKTAGSDNPIEVTNITPTTVEAQTTGMDTKTLENTLAALHYKVLHGQTPNQ